jgi:hypothetical protein
MTTQDIANKVESEFSKVYTHFQEFQQNTDYRKYWDKCIEAVMDRELLSHIIFCNDLFSIPPVKTFLMYYRDDFILITGKSNAELDVYIKKSIGAFWGMVFKFALGYQDQKSVSVSMYDYFIVKTASCFSNPKTKIYLEG